MPVDASIPLQVQTPKPPDPLEQFGRVAALQNSLAGLQGQRLENQQRQIAINQNQALAQAYKDAFQVDPQTKQVSFDPAKMQKTLANAGAGAAIMPAMKALTDYAQSQATLQKTRNEVQDQERDSAGMLALAVKAKKYDPTFAIGMLSHVADVNPQAKPQIDQAIQGIQQALQSDPTGKQAQALTQQITDSVISQSKGALGLQYRGVSAEGTAQRGQAAADQATIAKQKNLESAQAKYLGTATNQDEWDAGRVAYEQAGGDVSKIPAQFSPALAKAYQQKTAHEVATEQQAATNAANTEQFRSRQLSIEQQNANTSQDRLNMEKQGGTGAAQKFLTNAQQAEREEGTQDRLRQSLGNAIQGGAQYVDRNGNAMPWSKAVPKQAGEDSDDYQARLEKAKPAMIADMKARYQAATTAANQATSNKNNAMNRYADLSGDESARPKVSTDQAIRARGGQAQPNPAPRPSSGQQPASPSPSQTGGANAGTLPQRAIAQLKAGKVTTFANGQKWTLGADGKPQQVR